MFMVLCAETHTPPHSAPTHILPETASRVQEPSQDIAQASCSGASVAAQLTCKLQPLV